MMNTTHRRIALLTGASVAAIGMSAFAAAPALAQTAPHDTVGNGVYTHPDSPSVNGPGAVVTDTLVICDLAAPPTSPCFYGVIDRGPTPSNAVVNTPATGTIVQTGSGGDITLNIVSDGSAEIGAIAEATGPTASANATVTGAIVQTAVGTGDVDLNLTNDGFLLIDALAIATGTTGSAHASASINDAIIQSAVSTGGDVSIDLVNNGTLSIAATGIANAGDGHAHVHASLNGGINQIGQAVGGNATVALNNAGTLNIGAYASANAATGNAYHASASVTDAIFQSVVATGGTASALLTNAGTINIIASANAAGATGAGATASVGTGIEQVGAGDSVTLSLVNDGSITIAAAANAAAATTGSAYASASVDGVRQDAAGVTFASVNYDNNGAFVVTASANAVALTGYASATASVSYGISQEVDVVAGTGIAAVTNDGTMTIGAYAFASGASASADASVENAIDQDVDVAGNGAATVVVNNNNLINVSAVASAIGNTGSASASASITNEAFNQEAFVAGTGTAVASFVNAGTIDVLVSAFASGATFAGASADMEGVIEQSATVGAGTASAFVSNTTAGAINVLATANAVGTVAIATASVDDVIEQDVNVLAAGTAIAGITNAGAINVDAVANASGTTFALAQALFPEAVIVQSATAAAVGGVAVATMNNSGSIDINATASAVATQGTATAIAGLSTPGFAIEQNVVAGDTAVASFTNTGSVNLGASAVADGHDVLAVAIMGGVLQSASAPIVGLNFVNGGTMAVDATASAHGSTAVAVAAAFGNRQDAFATTSAVLYASNTGLISVNADAYADGADFAFALAVAGSGMVQEATAVGTAAFVSESMLNSGTVAVAANASATAGQIGVAVASAVAFDAMAQYAVAAGGTAASAVQFMSNATGGVVSLAATANAVGAGTAAAFAGALSAMYQQATAPTVSQSMVNNGTVTATANATAIANGTVIATTGEEVNVGLADASAIAFGMGQVADGTAAGQSMTNNGTLNVGAHALASAPATDTANGAPPAGSAFAFALATGAYQVNSATTATMNFTNAGEINVNAAATAVGTTGTASAIAIGYNGSGNGGATLTANIANTGTMNVSATAIAPGTAYALAQGIILENAPTPVFAATPLGGTTLVGFAPNPINGTITNDGVINVTAYASGGVASTASATGISIMSGINNMVVTNSGLISVDAIVENGDTANATGVFVGTNSTIAPTPLATDVFTFTNDGGTIIVRESVDGGATWRRGTAIDVSTAPNYSVINLLGDGDIYGNIDVAEGDDIFVEAGTTYFDGIINPECHVDYGGPGPAYDDPAVNACGQGTLTIQNGGNLILADTPWMGDATMYDGPSYVFVDTFNVAADGTITYQLTPETGGAQPLGSYPQVFADVANLDGTLVADIMPEGGLFADSYFWNNVIDAQVRNGTFDQCVIAGAYGDSPLLNLDCIYDANQNVDLGFTRVAFDAVPGLTRNQGSVAGGLECIYDDVGPAGLLGTPMGDLIAELFLFDGTSYPLAIEQLTGAGYAGYLQSFNSLGYRYNQILARATDCEVPALAGSALACRVAPMHLWGQVDYDTVKQDGDFELGDYDADRWSFLVGGDISVTPAAVVGASIGKVNNKVSYDDTDTRIKGDGWQFGLYGTYDPGAFYVKALGTWTKMDGDARRNINFAPFGGTIAGNIEGDPDVRMWTFGLHGGMRLPMGATSVITPFLNYDYTDVKLKGFTETGVNGANLRVNGGREKHSWLTGGVKWAGQMGGLVPEAMVGYRYMFGDRRASFNANFAGFEECDFDIVSMTEKRGAILAGLSIGGMLGGIDVRLGYNGAFNSDMTEHSGFLKLVVPLGAVAAPPPPPVVVAPPPPPPPPATQTCPDGSVILATDICPAPPPPPPPPAPAPERG